MGDTVNIIVTHQSAEQVARMLEWWHTAASADSLWIAYGGTREEYAQIAWPQKIYLESNRIRTPNPQRERQSYQEIFQRVVADGILDGKRYVHLAEYDQLPLQPAINSLQIRVLHRLKADVLGYRLKRVDGTNNPHFLYHQADPAFTRFFKGLSRRPDPGIVLSFVGFGSFWTAAAFRAVSAVGEPFPIYLELWMPTVAHHLGFSVRRIAEAEKFNALEGDALPLLNEAAAAGVWNLHPVKTRWNPETA